MRILFLGIIFLLISNVACAWIAEWVYPLDKSSLWRPPSYKDLSEEIHRLEQARRFVPHDPRYPYRLTELYQKAVSQRSFDFSSKDLTPTRVLQDFRKAIEARPLFPEYLVELALLFHSLNEVKGEWKNFPAGGDPLGFSDEKVAQAIYLSPKDHYVRAFAATYYQNRGMRQRSLALWRSILEEDISPVRNILKRCFDVYREPSFLPAIAPRKRVEELISFQGVLIGFELPGWDKEAYLKTLPLLIERSQKADANAALFEIIARTYQKAKDYRQAYLWYQKAFRAAKTFESKASLLKETVELLLLQGRLVEAEALLKHYLNFSSVDARLLFYYADTSWRLGRRKAAIESMKNLVSKKGVSPEWHDQLATFLYEEGRYQEAGEEWQKLLRESRGTAYEKANRDRILNRIQESQETITGEMGFGKTEAM